MEKITAETMRSYNRRQIFNHIYFNKRSSRQEIADTLHLSLTTVTQNLKMLEEENLIERSGYFQSTGGRKCVAYSCVSMYKISIGVHITAHHLRLVAVDMYGNIFKRRRITENYCHSREYYQQFGAHIDTFIRSLNISPKRVLGVGIALTALLSKDRQHIAKSVLLGTTEAQLADFKEFLSYPCQLFHDSEAAADAELWFSPGITDALYLGLNHHLNGMLIMNRKIHAGKEYSGGLVEHITLYPGGRNATAESRAASAPTAPAISLWTIRRAIMSISSSSCAAAAARNRRNGSCFWRICPSPSAVSARCSTAISSSAVPSAPT